MPVTLTLEGQVALVTGGSRGIGAAIVRMLVTAGARVFFNYEKAKGQAEKLARDCGQANCAGQAKSLDSPQAAGELVASCLKKFGRLDILVANHGIWPPEDAPIDRMTDEQWQKTVAVNLNAVFGLVKHSVAGMKKTASAASPAHIVLISSTAGQRGEAFHCD